MSGHADTIRLREHLVAGGRHAFVADLDALLAENQRWETTARNAGARVVELEAENQRLREALGLASDLLIGEDYHRDPDYRQEWQTICESLGDAE